MGRTFSGGHSTNIIHSIFKQRLVRKCRKQIIRSFTIGTVPKLYFTNAFRTYRMVAGVVRGNRGPYYIIFAPVIEFGHFGKRSGRSCKNLVILKFWKTRPYSYCIYLKSQLKHAVSPSCAIYRMQPKPVSPLLGNRHSLPHWECGLGR